MRYCILTTLALLAGLTLTAQGWQRQYGAQGDQRAFAVRLTADGGLVAAGSTSDSSGALTDYYFFRTDAFGQVLQSQVWGDSIWDESALTLMPDGNQNWLLYGNRLKQIVWGNFFSNITYATLTPAVQTQLLPSSESAVLKKVLPLTNGQKLFLGTHYMWGANDALIPRSIAILTDATHNVVWSEIYNILRFNGLKDAIQLAGNEFVVLGSNEYTNNDFTLLTIDQNGQPTDTLVISGDNVKGEKMLPLDAGHSLVVGTTGGGSDNSITLFHLAHQGLQLIKTTQIDLPGRHTVNAALMLPDGKIALAGSLFLPGQTFGDGYLLLTDTSGTVYWQRSYGSLKGDIFWDVQYDALTNGFVLAGQTNALSNNQNLQAWLVRTDSLGHVWSNTIVGQVTRDSMENCVYDSGEPALANWLVRADGHDGWHSFVLTDSLGHYEISADTGLWYVSVLPKSVYWAICTDSTELNFPSFNDTLTADFSVQTPFDCPLLEVDLSVPFLRRCFENTWTVRYFNNGPLAADQASIHVALDPWLTMVSSSLPYTVSGDTVHFDIGAVHSLSGGSFIFNTVLDCDNTTLGQTHCVTAHILPDSLCTTFDPNWDGSNLEVNGYCAGDSVVVTISNTGLSMQGAVDFVITEDQIIFKHEPLQLAAGQDTTFVLYPNGATVVVSTSQTPGHPVGNHPILLIEGCGSPLFTTGLVMQFGQDDGDPFTDTECRQNIGSFDPNDKTGIPLGTTGAGIIAPRTPIEYLIRFQNTGTDTAFRVEIRDTLSAALDLATFREGGSSHPYRLQIEGAGVLRFIFDPIALPDSSTSLAGSQGFVKFTLIPRAELPFGAEITNRAAIYFDFNAPILTNTTRHTIGDPFGNFQTPVWEISGANSRETIQAWPNPTTGQVRLYDRGRPMQPLIENGNKAKVSVWNSLGQPIQGFMVLPDATLDLSRLPNGVYYLCLGDLRTRIVLIR